MKIFKYLVCLVALTSCDDSSNKTLIPKSIVTGHLKDYSPDEIKLINDDLKNIETLCFRDKKPVKKPTYLATAGSPGALKSTTLETILAADPEYKNYVYADPDPRALKLMINTYINESLSFYAISQAENFAKAQVAAYTQWRWASNYIASTIINKAFAKNYNIAHGTTSTSPAITKLYKTLKDNGYRIELVLCSAQDKLRLDAVDHRSKTQANYQSTPEDVLNKGKMFPERFPDYFKNADKIRLYWADNLKQGSREVARIENGQVQIFDQDDYDKFVLKYQLDRAQSGKDLPSWDQLLDLNKTS